mmetsp:Transcript_29911/g.44642  ORF Transcript_29911/g.44642 Transcript_29911/m.44642 type:complete len:203 (-) Transcript_29911:282-890(-)
MHCSESIILYSFLHSTTHHHIINLKESRLLLIHPSTTPTKSQRRQLTLPRLPSLLPLPLQRLGPHNRHLHRSLPPILPMIMPPILITRPLDHLLLIQTIQHPIHHWCHCSQIHIHNSFSDGITNVFKVECLTFDEHSRADYCIDCSRHGEEFGGVGEFVGAGDFFDEDVFGGDFAFCYSCLNPLDQIGHMLIIPPSPQNTNT